MSSQPARPCRPPALALRGQSGSDWTRAALTWLRAAQIPTPGPAQNSLQKPKGQVGSRSRFLLRSLGCIQGYGYLCNLVALSCAT